MSLFGGPGCEPGSCLVLHGPLCQESVAPRLVTAPLKTLFVPVEGSRATPGDGNRKQKDGNSISKASAAKVISLKSLHRGCFLQIAGFPWCNKTSGVGSPHQRQVLRKREGQNQGRCVPTVY